MNAEPLVVAFEVKVTPAKAFDTWTNRCASWWPPSHTISGKPARITFDPRPGGAIVEHEADGSRHQWGEILEWEPPNRLRYRWHLFFHPSEATEIEITFTPVEDGTAVRLEQRGFEQLGDDGPPRRMRTDHVWRTITPVFIDACSNPTVG